MSFQREDTIPVVPVMNSLKSCTLGSSVDVRKGEGRRREGVEEGRKDRNCLYRISEARLVVFALTFLASCTLGAM